VKVQNMYMYRDIVRLHSRVLEVAWRLGSFEVNRYEAVFSGQRVYAGAWTIVSSSSEQVPEVKHIVRGNGRLAPAKLYSDRYSVGVENVHENELVEFVEAIANFEEWNPNEVEVDLTYSVEKRVIEHPEGVAEEVKGFTLVNIAVARKGRAVSLGIGFLGAPQRSYIGLLRSFLEDLATRARLLPHAQRLNPLAAGRWTVILYRDAAAALAHELSHLLEATSLQRLPLGFRVSEELSIQDDPFYPQSPAYRLFDDEAVEVKRKTLIDAGVVVGYLSTRETAGAGIGEPGNAFGLFHRPIPRHTTLYVKPGDWRENELLEETRHAILVDEILEANVADGVITIVPESAWLVERGNIVRPVIVSRVRIRVTKELRTIDAITRTPWLRVGFEKGAIVCELAPAIRLQAYVD